MIFVDNQNHTDPRINLAIEEYLLRKQSFSEPILLFYINEPSVIIGRNQNPLEEVDEDYIEENKIHIVRRLSGGGAVYHDLGNLNYSFITSEQEKLHNFAAFLTPVIKTLQEMGVPAEMGGNNDIIVEGKKVSGNAQFASQNRMFNHGTLLFDTSTEHMLRALNPKQNVIESKAVQSVRSFVTNIQDYLPDDMDVHAFREQLLAGLANKVDLPEYTLTAEDWMGIEKLRDEKYATWEWTVGRSPKLHIEKKAPIPYGELKMNINLENGRIKHVRFSGEFYGMEDISELEDQLKDVPFNKPSVAARLASTDISQYLHDLQKESFIELFVGA